MIKENPVASKTNLLNKHPKTPITSQKPEIKRRQIEKNVNSKTEMG